MKKTYDEMDEMSDDELEEELSRINNKIDAEMELSGGRVSASLMETKAELERLIEEYWD